MTELLTQIEPYQLFKASFVMLIAFLTVLKI